MAMKTPGHDLSLKRVLLLLAPLVVVILAGSLIYLSSDNRPNGGAHTAKLFVAIRTYAEEPKTHNVAERPNHPNCAASGTSARGPIPANAG